MEIPLDCYIKTVYGFLLEAIGRGRKLKITVMILTSELLKGPEVILR